MGPNSMFENRPPAAKFAYFAAHALKSYPSTSILRERIYDVHLHVCLLKLRSHLSPKSHQSYFRDLSPTLCTYHRLCALRRRLGSASITWCQRNPLIRSWKVVLRQKLDVALLAARFPFAYQSYRHTNVLQLVLCIARCRSSGIWLSFGGLVMSTSEALADAKRKPKAHHCQTMIAHCENGFLS